MVRPLAPSFVGFDRRWIRSDVVAGLTVWAVLVPESLAYASIAGVPPVVGLYAAVPALALYALLGSSRHLVVSPMSATAALSLSVVAAVATDPGDPAQVLALTTALALATGLVALVAGGLRLGFLAAFISEPVLKGFIIGLALTIMIGQLPALIGVDKGSGNFFEKSWDLIQHLGDAELLATTVGVGSLLLLLGLRRWLPIVPGSLVVALGSIALVAVLDLEDDGLDIVGHIEAGLPALGLPDVGGDAFIDLLGASVGVMLVGFAEGLGAAKTYAAKQGYDIDANKELLGLGVANLGAGLGSGMVVNGSLSKTAVNGGAGAKSQVSPLTAAVLTLVTLLFLTGIFEKLPEATLAAIVVAAVVELVDVASLRRLWRVQTGVLAKVYQVTSRTDFVGAVTAMLGVLIFDTLPGLAIGVCVSLLLLLARTSRPHLALLAPVAKTEPGQQAGTAWVDTERHPDVQPRAGVLVVRVEASLVFSNAEYVRDQVRALVAGMTPVPRLVVIDGQTTPSIDVTAAAMLTLLRGDLQRVGSDLALAHSIGQVRDVLRTAETEGEPPIYATIEDALASAPPPVHE
ncbi:MAG: SulP family inorganic anion transporter [Nocardioides sp.]